MFSRFLFQIQEDAAAYAYLEKIQHIVSLVCELTLIYTYSQTSLYAPFTETFDGLITELGLIKLRFPKFKWNKVGSVLGVVSRNFNTFDTVAKFGYRIQDNINMNTLPYLVATTNMEALTKLYNDVKTSSQIEPTNVRTSEILLWCFLPLIIIIILSSILLLKKAM